MKKALSLFLVCALVLGLAACGKKKEEATQPVTLPSEAPTEAQTAAADMANPMVEVTDPSAFGVDLGIGIDTDLLYAEAKMFIIDGRVAECQMSFENIMGENVDCTLRATKDETLAESLPGIYDSTLKEVNSIDYSSAGDTFTVKVRENDAQDTTVYTWKLDDTWYSVVLKGKPSQMEVAEVMDSVLLAIGVNAGSTAAAEAGETDAPWYELSEDGETLTVRLVGNATTGFEWTYKIWDENSLECISEVYTPDAAGSGLVGAGGIWEASFKATGPDRRNNYDSWTRNDVRFTYSRNWEDPVMPSKVLDLNIVGAVIEVVGVHEPDFTTPVADDGEYPVTLHFNNMIEENDLSVYALVGLPETITFTDEEVAAAKVGDVIPLSQYGQFDITIDRYNKLDETTIEITDWERFSYREDLGAWVIVGSDDDICRYNKEYRTVHFTNETEIDDGMEEIMKTGNTGTIYDKMKSYVFVDADIRVKDGFVEKIRIHYHP